MNEIQKRWKQFNLVYWGTFILIILYSRYQTLDEDLLGFLLLTLVVIFLILYSVRASLFFSKRSLPQVVTFLLFIFPLGVWFYIFHLRNQAIKNAVSTS